MKRSASTAHSRARLATARVLIERAERLKLACQFNEALTLFEEARELVPPCGEDENNARIQLGLAGCAWALGDRSCPHHQSNVRAILDEGRDCYDAWRAAA